MIVELLIFVVTTLVAYIVYIHKRTQWQFDKDGVKYLPGYPLAGNMLQSLLLRKHFLEDLADLYAAFPNERYIGIIEGITPIIMIRDPEIIKNIAVKDFDHFIDHKSFFPPEIDTLFGDSILMMKGERWRDMRTTLSPAFTGSKMKQMVPFMLEIAHNIVEHLKERQNEDLDLADIARRFTNDVIASAGFGLQVNSLKDRENEFFKMGNGLFNFTSLQRVKLIFLSIFPELAKNLGLKLFPKQTTDFFNGIVARTIDYRKKNKVERPDMIHLLIEASKGTLKENNNVIDDKDNVGFATVQEALKPLTTTKDWTFSELSSQVFIFFVAGFENVATTLVMCVHELALNLEIQEKLFEEIKQFKEKNDNLSYENVNELKYLDCVLNETFRKWSTAVLMDRVCTKPYELPPPRDGGKPYRLNVGDSVYNVVNNIHKDPMYFPDPENFNPDRFSDENKHNIKPFTFMPFGMGPRNCIGSRFALLELKIFMYNLVLNFKILKGPKTSDPLKMEPHDFNVKACGGTWVQFEGRN